MTIFERALPFQGDDVKDTTGTMKGGITNIGTDKKLEFVATFLWRDEQDDSVRLHGSMLDPNDPKKYLVVGFKLKNKDTPSGTYSFDDPRVLYFSYSEHSANTVSYDAKSGYIELERAPSGEVRINGRMEFTTVAHGGNQYKVDVIFDLKGMS